jgi:4-hydroxy-4-methyl-2-oxoglutarate aldolase
MPLLDRLRLIDTASLSDADKGLRVLPSAIRRLAAGQRMVGRVVDGLCRDSAQLVRLGLPVYSRGTTPRAPGAKAVPVVQVPIRIGAADVRPGDVILGDDDGILVGSVAEFEAAVDAAEAIQTREKALRSSIEQGQSLFDSLNFAEHAERLRAGLDSALTFNT